MRYRHKEGSVSRTYSGAQPGTANLFETSVNCREREEKTGSSVKRVTKRSSRTWKKKQEPTHVEPGNIFVRGVEAGSEIRGPFFKRPWIGSPLYVDVGESQPGFGQD